MSKSDLKKPVTDAAIERSAAGMIAAFGGDAAQECQAVLDRMEQARDSAGEAVWRRIFLVVQALQPRKPMRHRPAGELATNAEPQLPD
jgi:hypothetical protein